MDTRQSAYRDLVARVNASYPPRDLSDDGRALRLYRCDDCMQINLWTYWQGADNPHAKILLVGQDWGCPWDPKSRSTMQQIQRANQGEAYDYLDKNTSKTDENLVSLFYEIGYDIRSGCPDLFFTNLVLGYRNKGTSSGYKKIWAQHDKGFFQELANILAPQVILCLGRSTWEGVLCALGSKLPAARNYNRFIESAENPVAVTLENGETTHVFALAHCGAMGTLNRNRKRSTDLGKQIEDWKRILPYIR